MNSTAPSSTSAAPRLAAAASRLTKFARRHWRGWLRLPVSFWLLGVLPPLTLLAVVDALSWWIEVPGRHLQAAALAWLLGWLLLVLLLIWGTVGAWRSAGQSLRQRALQLPIEVAPNPPKPPPAAAGAPEPEPPLFVSLRPWLPSLPRVAQAVILLLALVFTVAGALRALPRLADRAALAIGSEPLGHLRIETSADGTTLRLQGPFGLGDAERVRRVAQPLAALAMLELSSPGGRMHEAETLAAWVREHGLVTRATGACDHACGLVLLAGQRRQVLPEGSVRLHRIAAGTLLPWWQPLANRVWAQTWANSGLPAAFITKALSTPPNSLWMLETDELLAGGLITQHERPLDIDLPGQAEAPPKAYAAALRTSPHWWALERRQQGLLSEAAERMHAARAGGADAETLQAAAQQLVDERMPGLAASASTELQQGLLQLLADQLSAVQELLGAEGCRRLRSGDPLMRRVLPAALAVREATWLLHAAQEKPVALKPLRSLNPLEREVLRRTLGERHAALLPPLWRTARSTAAPDCERSRSAIAAVLQLPVAERRLALRAVFPP